ncbi:aldehyde dehydrogenase family protein [Xylanibacillus composti]|uniref:Putative aldehyde dehydrogenase YcbD n=1 Tax=Xylanibacillus composti TaxID=1572762 RepID=A0A8J4H1A8_9BACL|nr:alpha-ketoglutaric semialdehyde dehydrogenase GucD [Xylanibacillus composti]MDT9725345.1 aldehyde dehydrogenase family protein [Xylanibacillus composti]GIQ69107.1 putative aldehyde dehydrogenase YcbD [Xylanibacillus composti]
MNMHETITVNNYVNGAWTAPSSEEKSKSINPANMQEIVGLVPDSTLEDLDRAVAAAEAARTVWRKLPGAERGSLLYKAADLLEQRADDIGVTMTREMGKTLPEAKGETLRGVAILRYYAGEGMRKIGDVIPSTDADAFMYTTRSPLGVVGVISPWNFPVAIPIWKIAPALIYGNAVVWKPATETAVTAAKVMACFHDAGFPAGVLNMVVGSGSVIGHGIASHPGIHGVTFTGSNAVGKHVGQAALSRGAKYQLEMGGKNPIIVAADADLDLAVDAAISGGLKSTGQKCTATSRVIVVKDIYESFKARLVEKVAALKVGDGLDPSTWMGPCANESQMMQVLDYVKKGIEEGAELLVGGQRVEEKGRTNGFYVSPAVFDKVTATMTIAREEIFGPVLALIEVDSFEEAIQVANDSEYGLSASIYTKNIGHILQFVQDMEAGLVRVNAETAGVELQAPFGGMKQSSSHSREQGQAAIEFFTSIKTVFIKP